MYLINCQMYKNKQQVDVVTYLFNIIIKNGNKSYFCRVCILWNISVKTSLFIKNDIRKFRISEDYLPLRSLEP